MHILMIYYQTLVRKTFDWFIFYRAAKDNPPARIVIHSQFFLHFTILEQDLLIYMHIFSQNWLFYFLFCFCF